MTDRLADKVCLITGGGSGIGRATALAFASEGASVAVADIDQGAAGETVDLIEASGFAGMAAAFTVDVTDPAETEDLATAVIARFGRIDVLFNNAGIAGVGVLHETSVELWDRVMAVNVRGVFLVARAVLPHMIAAGRGSIINMSSTIAEIGLANRASYAASKGAVLSLDATDAGRLRRHTGSASTRCCPGRSTRRSWTATSRRATTTRSPASRRSRSASSPATSAGPRMSRPRPCSSRPTNHGSSWGPGCSWTAACAARSEVAMRLLTRAIGRRRAPGRGRPRRSRRRRRRTSSARRAGRWRGSSTTWTGRCRSDRMAH